MTDLTATLQVLDGVSGPDSAANWRAVCPKCNRVDNPSLSLKASQFGTVIYKCFRDCAPAGIAAVVEARLASGQRRSANVVANQRRALSKDETFASAMRIWTETKPAAGTPVESYLRSRAIKLLPLTLRFHPNLKHQSGGYHPAMVAAVVDANARIVGIHRTFLTSTGEKADVEPVKMALGPLRGGAVRLVTAESSLVPTKLAVAEGIETALSVMQATGLDAWAALGTSGLRNVVLPEGVKEITICADGDEAGDKAARILAARLRYAENRVVRVARAPQGKDFNDLLCSKEKVKM